MGTFCIVLGIIIFIVFLVTGYGVAAIFSMEGLWNIINGSAEFKLADFLRLPAAEDVGTYVVCLAIFGVLGLLFGVGVFMTGLSHKKLSKKLRSVERIARRAGRRG